MPIYPETKGLTSKGIRFILKPLVDSFDPVDDFLPLEIREANGLMEVNDALRTIHFPETLADAEKARYRFAFEEIFLLQLRNLRQKLALRDEKGPKITLDEEKMAALVTKLPFDMTGAQKKALNEIVADLGKEYPMNRLLQGDVGSGKTAVAGIAAIIVAETHQVAIMAPTEILANQHYKTFLKLFHEFTGGIALLVGKEAKVFYGPGLETKITKIKLTNEISAGRVKITIGTHALIQRSVKFHELGLVIVDEQHRFGVNQRQALVSGPTRTKTQTDTEDAQNTSNLLYTETTYKIRAAVFAVKKELGLGHKESIYQKALAEEFKKTGLLFSQEKAIDIKYGDKKIGIYRPDFIVEDKILIELKALPFIGAIQQKQIWSYLKGSDHKLALLINFGGTDIEIKRVIHDGKRGPRESASSQRQSAIPHFLSMSATPIPRTMMIAVFGDLDLSIIDELPKGRKEIITKVVAGENRDKAYAFIRGQVRQGRQVYVICPRIQLPEEDSNYKAMLAYDTKAVEEEYQKLSKKVFPDLRVTMLHGKLKAAEKSDVMHAFAEGESDILVSTSVIEVGVDVPNATIMMIESAERFGLSQLYQFRGRVGRSDKQSFCFLFTESGAKAAETRLKALVSAKNGFELAEKDLELRGPGQFMGGTQTGLPDIAMRSLQNPNLLKEARETAEKIMKKDPALAFYPGLNARIAELKEEIHME